MLFESWRVTIGLENVQWQNVRIYDGSEPLYVVRRVTTAALGRVQEVGRRSSLTWRKISGRDEPPCGNGPCALGN
jgi:hypothetical protein